MDADGHQGRWLAWVWRQNITPETWRYWKIADRTWTIVAPHGLAEFEQRHQKASSVRAKVLTAATQWEATWRAVGYFYSHVVPTLPAPPMN